MPLHNRQYEHDPGLDPVNDAIAAQKYLTHVVAFVLWHDPACLWMTRYLLCGGNQPVYPTSGSERIVCGYEIGDFF